jgi:phosphatidate cytidylyltransferase
MLKRTITAFFIILITVPACLFSHTIVWPIFVSLLSFCAVYEMLGCVGTRRNIAVAVPALLAAAVFPFAVRLTDSAKDVLCLFLIGMIGYLVYLFALSVFSHGKMALEDVFATFTTVFYIIASFGALVLLRDREFGLYLLILTMYGPWISDVFAYFCGRLFGRHKLIPDVSPNKTVEGAIGGVVFCALAAMLYGFILTVVIGEIASVNYGALALIGALIAVISQIGDLIMSHIKRKYGIKDYGFVLPGHGGILDRFDSVLGVVPLVVILSELVKGMQLFQ